ncbi:MAG: hypothetical protein HY451_00745 [Parcubacteria group bacterium]|nr:hypothetical protein [Parcubacteria group bacterium]
MKYAEMTWGTMEAVVNKLGGMGAVELFLRDELVVKATERIFFAVWKTVKLGVHKTPDAYEKAIEAAGFRTNEYALKILKKISVSQTEIELDLVVVTPADLGLKNPTYQQICDRAVESGLEKCPREVGPVLRIDYPDQPYGEWLLVAMEPEAGSDGILGVFRVGHGDRGRWLDARWFFPQDTWCGGARFVFVRSRK